MDFKKSPEQIKIDFCYYEKSIKREYSSWLFDDVNEVLTQLKVNNYTLALASNSQQYKISEVIHQNNLHCFFKNCKR